jgi:hypothetical protein
VLRIHYSDQSVDDVNGNIAISPVSYQTYKYACGGERQLPGSETLILVGTSGFYRLTRRQVDTNPESLCVVLDTR